ncbi:MAG: protein kinase, partial [Anaerolineae bacterium]|nr:protein kinase [Anaerolineae bacterium]
KATTVTPNNRQQQLLFQLINTVFNAVSFDQFTEHHYPSVAKRFTPDMNKSARIQSLIDSFEDQADIGSLIAKIKQVKPAEYEAFAQRARAGSPRSAASPPTSEGAAAGTGLASFAGSTPKSPLIHNPERFLKQTLEKRYQINEVLDKTGLGAVFKAYDTKLKLDVAIKIIDLERVKLPAMQERVRQEVRTAMKLDHPGVVKIYDFGQTDTLLYIIMEFISGQNLAEARRRFGSLNLDTILSDILTMMRQICLTVDYMHQHGVLHPGTKPENIMLKPGQANQDQAWQPCLINLGLLRPHREMVLSKEPISSRRLTYTVSPELLLGHATDTRSDVYALGVMLYDLVVGHAPFRPADLDEAVRLHVEASPPLPSSIKPNIPHEVEQIILKALAKDPADRYLSAKGMAQAIQDYLSSTALPAPTIHPEITIDVADPHLAVIPGQTLTTAVTFRNKGQVEDYCKINVQGIPPEWVSLAPAAISIAPGETVEVKLSIQPPRSSLSRAGRHAMLIQASSEHTPDHTTEIQKVLTVAPYSEFQCSIWPQEISAGQITQITVENQGNMPETFTITAHQDPSLIINPDQAQVKVGPGESQTTDLRVSPRRRRFIAESNTQTFSFDISNSQKQVKTLSGQMTSAGDLRPVWILAAMVSCAFIACAAFFFSQTLGEPNTVAITATVQWQKTVDAQNASSAAGTVQAVATQEAEARSTAERQAWLEADDDLDRLKNGEELANGTRLDQADSDGDGIQDFDEINTYDTEPMVPDTDYDGLLDGQEIQLGLNPKLADSDGDGETDTVDDAPNQTPTPTATISPTPAPTTPVPALVNLSQTTYSVNEAEGQVRIVVRLNNPSREPVFVTVSVSDGTAYAGSDYTRPQQTVTFSPNDLEETVIIPISDDGQPEASETFRVTLTQVQGENVLLGPIREAVVTIGDRR